MQRIQIHLYSSTKGDTWYYYGWLWWRRWDEIHYDAPRVILYCMLTSHFDSRRHHHFLKSRNLVQVACPISKCKRFQSALPVIIIANCLTKIVVMLVIRWKVLMQTNAKDDLILRNIVWRRHQVGSLQWTSRNYTYTLWFCRLLNIWEWLIRTCFSSNILIFHSIPR